MKAMLLYGITNMEKNKTPLVLEEISLPIPKENEVLVKVTACGICHTELDEIEGRTPPPKFPIIPGHQVVGKVIEIGKGVRKFRVDERVGVAWIHSACGKCKFCLEGRENLCEQFEATGRDAHGGYAEYTTVPEDFAYRIPDIFSDTEAAPLLCAGAVGYRSLILTNLKDGDNLGLVGFGASAHLVIQMAKHRFPHAKIFVFARSKEEKEFARQLGAFWTGDIEEKPPERIHSAIDTTPVWKPIVDAMNNLERGGRLVINAIRKEEFDKEALLNLKYSTHLWLEKEIKSVANVTRHDTEEFLLLASKIPIKPATQLYTLEEANSALCELKERKIRGAKVLVIPQARERVSI
jgi:propanol-preferring alcohol dehydrogenase